MTQKNETAGRTEGSRGSVPQTTRVARMPGRMGMGAVPPGKGVKLKGFLNILLGKIKRFLQWYLSAF